MQGRRHRNQEDKFDVTWCTHILWRDNLLKVFSWGQKGRINPPFKYKYSWYCHADTMNVIRLASRRLVPNGSKTASHWLPNHENTEQSKSIESRNGNFSVYLNDTFAWGPVSKNNQRFPQSQCSKKIHIMGNIKADFICQKRKPWLRPLSGI